MKDIIQKARDLATAILDSDTFARLRSTEDKVMGDPTAVEMTTRYEQTAMALQAKEQRMEPISPEEKRAFQELQEQITAHPDLQALMEAQAEYRALMEAVNETIHKTLQAGFEQSAGASPEQEEAASDEGGGRIIIP